MAPRVTAFWRPRLALPLNAHPLVPMPLLASPPAPTALAPYVASAALPDTCDRLTAAERRALLTGLLSLGTLEYVEFDEGFDVVRIVAVAPSGRRYEGLLNVADLPLSGFA